MFSTSEAQRAPDAFLALPLASQQALQAFREPLRAASRGRRRGARAGAGSRAPERLLEGLEREGRTFDRVSGRHPLPAFSLGRAGALSGRTGAPVPLLQGARLTAWELVQEGIPATLLADGAAPYLMKQGKVQWVIVGADRIAANGDTANKIGTYMTAVAARHHGVKFMVVAPTSTVDLATADGSAIPIETRAESEVLNFAGTRTAPEGIHAWNPAFDVTPAELIDAIVTEKGVVERPSRAAMAAMMAS